MPPKPTLQELEHYLYHEARLIDEKRWDEWGALFAEDGEYWVPATRGQPDPKNHVSLIYETALLREVRLRRYRHPNAMSLQPQPYSVHLISNVMLDEFDESSGACVVTSRFIMLEYRRNQQHSYGGATSHRLEPSPQGYRIRMKKDELINCDIAKTTIQTFF
jgi:benzoate/toluate 1,2-dioxygenase beta subunit